MSVFSFAWVNATDTVWLSAYEREDLEIFSFDLTHAEGDFPTLSLEIQNPYEGLLAAGRKLWAWFAINLNGTITPLFFGRLQGLPDNLFEEVITIKFIARSYRYLMYKQAVAEGLMLSPYYDPVFLSADRRDDADAVLEGYSRLFHWDRLPSGSPADLAVTTSDLLNGEDGTITFGEDDGFYDSVSLKIGQQPLTKVRVRATVNWTQRFGGSLDLGTRSETCWTGGSLIGDWPKPGTQLQGGWTIASSYAIGDGAQYGVPSNQHFSWENREQTHVLGDTMSIDNSWTTFPCGGDTYINSFYQQVGIVDPLGINVDGSVGVNIPAHVSYSQTLVCRWNVQLSLALEYEAVRPHTETIEFEVSADLQPILTDPNSPASLDTEVITLSGGDVGLPILKVRNWFSLYLSGELVKLGTVVQSTAEYIGKSQYSICVGEGTVGSSEPAWSNVLGTSVNDGTVVWASLGDSGPPTDFPTWQSVAFSSVQLGTVIAANWYLPAPLDNMGIPIPAPAAGISSFQICTTAGTTQKYSDELGDGVADLSPNWPEPVFSPTAGETTNDGTVVWTSLGDGSSGSLDIPIGLKNQAYTYFPGTRGNASIAYALGVARAHILARARCVEVSFECAIDKALALSCRKNGLLYDPRLPGGQILGKIKAYKIIGNGDDKTFLGKVTLAAAIGYGNAITTTDGTPVYVVDGYVAKGYQHYTDAVVAVSVDDSDLGYTPPLAQLDVDGILFPLSYDQAVVKDEFITGTPPGAAQFLPNTDFTLVQNLDSINNPFGTTKETTVERISIPNGYTHTEIPVDQTYPGPLGVPAKRTVQEVVFYPITQYYLELVPMQGVSFGKQYNVTVTDLKVPKMIDLEAPASP